MQANRWRATTWPRVRRLTEGFNLLKAEMGKVIVGQHAVLEELLIAIFARGHCLLIGVPGLAKTLMIHTLADALNLTYNRIQFTPDLMPSDITGTEVIQEDKTWMETRARRISTVPLKLWPMAWRRGATTRGLPACSTGITGAPVRPSWSAP